MKKYVVRYAITGYVDVVVDAEDPYDAEAEFDEFHRPTHAITEAGDTVENIDGDIIDIGELDAQV